MRDATARVWLALLALLVTAGVTGCLGTEPTGTATPEPSPTPTTSPTSTAPSTDCPPALTVYEIDQEPVDPDEAVAYENLTATQQATFQRARNESVEDFGAVWDDTDLVVHDGTYYRAGIVVC